jgi:predicted MPP superfamily phosphohydrolase
LNVVLDLSTGRYHEGAPNDFGRLRRELEVAGVVCLENESRQVTLPDSTFPGSQHDDGIWIVGIDDMFIGRDNLDDALAGVPPNALKILLTHTVENPEELARRGFDAVFAGHSHGGQMRLPFFGPVITRSSLPRKYASGVFEMAGTQFHLNNGIGAGKWTPFRFLCRPEATFIELTGRQRTKRA